MEDKKTKVSPHVPSFIKEHVQELSRYLCESKGETGGCLAVTAVNEFPTSWHRTCGGTMYMASMYGLGMVITKTWTYESTRVGM